MRTLEKSDTPILSGMRIYHNFVKSHQALEGKTPAEAAGIQVKGQDDDNSKRQQTFEIGTCACFKYNL